jgi:hypothetical protein
MQDLVAWLARTPLHDALLVGGWVQALQTVHILAVCGVIGSVTLTGARVARGPRPDMTVAATTRRFAPWLWASLAILLASGLLMVIAEPARELHNIFFWSKMALLAVASATTVWFHASVRRNSVYWEREPSRRRLSVVFAALTVALWLSIAVAGRWIAYVENATALPTAIFN